MEKEEQAKREAEEAQTLAQQTEQWSSVVPPNETQADAPGNWDADVCVNVACVCMPSSFIHTVGCYTNGSITSYS